MIIVRGGGDIATGTIYRLHQCGYAVLILETSHPTAIRRKVSFCEAVYDGTAVVEGVKCRLAESIEQCRDVWSHKEIPLMIDPRAEMIQKLHPDAVIDAILAKKNLGTNSLRLHSAQGSVRDMMWIMSLRRCAGISWGV